jgi:hypothetical protein
VIKFVSDLRQAGGFLWVLWFPSINKTDRHDITEILLKVALSTIKPTNHQGACEMKNSHILAVPELFPFYVLWIIVKLPHFSDLQSVTYPHTQN